MASYKKLLTALENERAKVASHQAEAQRLEKEIRQQQGQLKNSAHAAIGAAILRGISEGWVQVDAEKLRAEAVASLPARWRDSIEVVADCVAAAQASAPETAAAKTGVVMTGVPLMTSAPAEPDPIDDLIAALTQQAEPDADETAWPEAGVPSAAIEPDQPAALFSTTAATAMAPIPPPRRHGRPGVVRPVPDADGFG